MMKNTDSRGGENKMANKILNGTLRTAYGKTRVVLAPTPEAQAIKALTGRDGLTEAHVKAMGVLGLDVNVVVETPTFAGVKITQK